MRGVLELVASVRDDVGMGCLSNMNEVQWHANDEGARSPGPSPSASSPSNWGWSSPTAGSSRRSPRVSRSRACQRVLFLDYNAANVAGAEASGFEARHVRGVEEARRVLRAEGVLGS